MSKKRLLNTEPLLVEELVDESLADVVGVSYKGKVSWMCKRGHFYAASPASRVYGHTGCPYCSGREPVPGENDLVTTHPALAGQLVDKAYGMTLSAGSHKQVEWRCLKGHVWTASVANRVKGSGCPVCAGQRVSVGENDLLTTHPRLACELAEPTEALGVKAGSRKKLKWRCDEGHEWVASVSSRMLQGAGCPECARQAKAAGLRTVAVDRPWLSKRKVVVRQGVCGHMWDVEGNSPSACPVCARQAMNVGFESGLAAMVHELAEAAGMHVVDDWEGTGCAFVAERHIAIGAHSLYGQYGDNRVHVDMLHIGRRRKARSQNMRYVGVWEDDWLFRRDAVKLMLSQVLGVAPPIPDTMSVAMGLSDRDGLRFLSEHDISWREPLAREFALRSISVSVGMWDKPGVWDGDGQLIAVLIAHIGYVHVGYADGIEVDAFCSLNDGRQCLAPMLKMANLVLEGRGQIAMEVPLSGTGAWLHEAEGLRVVDKMALRPQALAMGKVTSTMRVPWDRSNEGEFDGCAVMPSDERVLYHLRIV